MPKTRRLLNATQSVASNIYYAGWVTHFSHHFKVMRGEDFFNDFYKGSAMGNNTSPLESLAAFAITFVAGIVTTVALNGYVSWVKKSQSK